MIKVDPQGYVHREKKKKSMVDDSKPREVIDKYCCLWVNDATDA